MWRYQKTELTTAASTTMATPRTCGKSLRMNSSVLGQIRHWVICFSVTLPAGTGNLAPQREQAIAGELCSKSAVAGWSQVGQRKMTFIAKGGREGFSRLRRDDNRRSLSRKLFPTPY